MSNLRNCLSCNTKMYICCYLDILGEGDSDESSGDDDDDDDNDDDDEEGENKGS